MRLLTTFTFTPHTPASAPPPRGPGAATGRKSTARRGQRRLLPSPHYFLHLTAAAYQSYSGVGAGEQECSNLTATVVNWLHCPALDGVWVRPSPTGHFLRFGANSSSPHHWKPATLGTLLKATHSSLDHCLFLLQLLGNTKDQPSASKWKFSHIETLIRQMRRCLPFHNRILMS